MYRLQFFKTFILAAIFAVLLVPEASMALPVSTTDAWDISNGITIDDTTGALSNSDIANIFGSVGGVEGEWTLLKDRLNPPGGAFVPPGYDHYVEWHTTDSITLRSFNLVARNEGMDRRAFNNFSLYVYSGGDWQEIFSQGFTEYGGSPTYGALDTTWLELAVDLDSPVTAQYFRAEFTQAPWTDGYAIGPRIRELDGYETYLDGSIDAVPLPASIVLFGFGLLGTAGFRRKLKR